MPPPESVSFRAPYDAYHIYQFCYPVSPRPGSSDRSGNLGTPHEHSGPSTPRKSQDAAVGALVQMLKKAPPLGQDFNRSQNVYNKPSRLENSSKQIQVPPVAEVAFFKSGLCLAISGVKTTLMH
ncbi:autophagy-related protein 13b-like protein [Tanacetum coccineum]